MNMRMWFAVLVQLFIDIICFLEMSIGTDYFKSKAVRHRTSKGRFKTSNAAPRSRWYRTDSLAFKTGEILASYKPNERAALGNNMARGRGFRGQKYTADDRFGGNGPFGKIFARIMC